MAYDKVVDSAMLDGALTGIADAIRGKTGGAGKLTMEGMAQAIAALNVGSGGATGIYMAKITPTENLTGGFPITHNLGTTDILYVAVWAESLGEITPTINVNLCKMWAKTDIPTRRGGNGFSAGCGWDVSNSYAYVIAPNTADYETIDIIDDNRIVLPKVFSGVSNYYSEGVTYTVIVIAENAEV